MAVNLRTHGMCGRKKNSCEKVAVAFHAWEMWPFASATPSQAEADVFNALNLMDNGSTFEDLKFREGDGHLHYYLFNWQCPAVAPNRVGLVLL